MIAFDSGPPPAFAEHFARVPDYAPFKDFFWFDWGPIFYRGRLDGSARVLCIASDPGATERIAGRTLVGDAGQRVQGFLGKLGLTRSYVCVNAFPYGLFPSRSGQAGPILRDPVHTTWRNELFDMLKTPNLQAVIAFGVHARNTVKLWPDRGGLPLFQLPHPTSHDEAQLLAAWRAALAALRMVVVPDANGDPTKPTYGQAFAESDYAPIPPHDLPWGVPIWIEDNAWSRQATPPQRSSITRPQPDDRHTLIWIAPRS
jgi:uracil-DNA glycosylase